MDHDTKARLIALANTPIGQLTLIDVGFLAHTFDGYPEEVGELVPELAWLLEEL